MSDLKNAFKIAASRAVVKKKSYAKKIGTGMTSVIKVPWKITKVVVLSLEKVTNLNLTNNTKYRLEMVSKPHQTMCLISNRKKRIEMLCHQI